jgi:NADPH2:quinone reductase
VQCLPIRRDSISSVPPACGSFFTVWANIFGTPRSPRAKACWCTAARAASARRQSDRRPGHRVFTTAAGADQCAALERLGATRAIDFTREDFAPVIKEATGGKGVNVILDIVGGDNVARDIASIARDSAGGRLNVNADTAAGAVAAAVKAEKLVIVSDTHGIRSDPKDPDSLVPT